MNFPSLAFALSLLMPGLAMGQGLTRDAVPNKDLITSPQSVTVQSTEITSQDLEMWSTDTETRGVFSGNVIVTGTNLKLTCDRLEITATGIGDKNSAIPTVDKFKYLLATGKVRIVQGDREATCGRAEVFPRDNRILMTQEPMVIDHGNDFRYVGEDLELLRGERRVRGKGVHVIMPEIKDLGFDKNQPAPAAESVKPTTPPSASGVENKPTQVTPK